ncbi:Acyl-CoA ligase sidI [Penicillium atrosanguineum]|nr:Acyl-CoA ligase sidI [Penicillium atrosanguineum]
MGPSLPEANTHPTVCQFLSKSVQEHGDKTAIVSRWQPNGLYPEVKAPTDSPLQWSYKELYHGASLLAAALHRRGVREGMPIAVFLPNGVEWALTFWASIIIGAPFASLDMRSLKKPEEAALLIQSLSPGAIIVADGATAHALNNDGDYLLPAMAVKVFAGSHGSNESISEWDCLGSLLAEPKSTNELHEAKATSDRNAPVLICHTSGTTSLPKGCPHTSETIWAASSCSIVIRQITAATSLLQHLPLSHVLAIMNLISFWRVGGKVVFPSPSFDPKASIDCLEAERCTHLSAVPPVLLAMVHHPSFSPEKTGCLQNVALGATVITRDTLDLTLNKEKLAAQSVTLGFGMSEGMNTIAFLSGDEIIFNEDGITSVGRVTMGAGVKICEPGTRKVLPIGESGELHHGGPHVLAQYLDGNRDGFYTDENGHRWIATGDQAIMDQSGAIFITSRYKDVIIRGGNNISPAVIELTINKIPGVTAQVVGVPDSIAGERPVAVLQIYGDVGDVKNSVRDTARKVLRDETCDVDVVTLQELGLEKFPMTTSGKIKKGELKSMAWNYLKSKQSGDLFDSEETPSSPGHRDLETILLNRWAHLTGTPVQIIVRDSPIADQADSLTLMRFKFDIERQTGKKLALEALSQATTMKDLLVLQKESPLKSPLSSHLPAPKEGPPAPEDMVHCRDTEYDPQQTIDAFNPILSNLGRTWEQDVESCYPMPDFPRKFVHGPRPNAPLIKVALRVSEKDVSRLRKAIEQALAQWPATRVLITPFDAELMLYAVLRASSFFDLCITENSTVERYEDLMNMEFSDACDTRLGFEQGVLFRVHIVRISSTGGLGVVALAHHGMIDGVSFSNWAQDLNQILRDGKAPPRTSFQVFAELFYTYRKSLSAQRSIDYHVNRLRGIEQNRSSLWPPARTSQFFLGPDTEYVEPDNSPGNPRKHLDPDGQAVGLRGLQADMDLPGLFNLRNKHSVPGPVVLKAAIALFNMRQTKTRTAIFGATTSGRSWPFLPPALEATMPDPIDIAGPCIANIAARVQIEEGQNGPETIGHLLQRLVVENENINRHMQAPQELMQKQLGEKDAQTIIDARRHQIFNFFGGYMQAGADVGDEGRLVRTVGQEWTADIAFVWKGAPLGPGRMRVWVHWDGAQVCREEVQKWLDELVDLSKQITAEDAWERKATDFL